jgi:hypothetical protein
MGLVPLEKYARRIKMLLRCSSFHFFRHSSNSPLPLSPKRGETPGRFCHFFSFFSAGKLSPGLKPRSPLLSQKSKAKAIGFFQKALVFEKTDSKGALCFSLGYTSPLRAKVISNGACPIEKICKKNQNAAAMQLFSFFPALEFISLSGH